MSNKNLKGGEIRPILFPFGVIHYGKGGDCMAKGQGRSSGQGVKLLIIRDYLRSHATKDRLNAIPCLHQKREWNGSKAIEAMEPLVTRRRSFAFWLRQN